MAGSRDTTGTGSLTMWPLGLEIVGHFRFVFCLSIKTSLRAKPFK